MNFLVQIVTVSFTMAADLQAAREKKKKQYFFLCFIFLSKEACGILAPQPGMEPTPSALGGKVLTTGPPGKLLIIGISLLVNVSLRPSCSLLPVCVCVCVCVCVYVLVCPNSPFYKLTVMLD